MPIRPLPNSLVQQANPDFSWPLQGTSAQYDIEIWNHDLNQIVAARRLTTNWITFRERLATGTFRWRVRAITSTTGPWSDWRYFSVTAASTPFSLPDWNTAFLGAANRLHPRGLWQGAELDNMRRVITQERAFQWKILIQRVQSRYSLPLVAEPPRVSASTGTSEYYQWMFSLPQQLAPQVLQIEEASLLWMVQGDPTALNDAKRRVLSLAQLDPNGGSAYEPSHHAPRNLLWALAIGYDRMYWHFTEAERDLIRRAVDARFKQIEASINGPDKMLESYPLDSHGWVGLQALASVSAILAGDIPNSRERFFRYVPWALNSISPWGGEQGGFSNGTAYASWNLELNLFYWDGLRQAAGINVYAKPAVANHINLYAYFTPVGTPSHVFGDGAEKPSANYVTYALAARTPGRVSQHVLSSIGMPDDPYCSLVLSSPPIAPSIATSLPNAIHLPDLGWVAMHSNLADRQRISVYFKSSPYGSFNHSHADQNSFVLNANGKRLLIDSGYYDWYQSPHRTQWYRTTRAHNAMTFDGGQGQVTNTFVGDVAADGDIRFFRDYGRYVVTTGGAVPAYGGVLTRALRTLVYVRPSTLFVVDQLASPTARRWEWNLHALQSFASLADGSVAVNGNGACIKQIFGPPTAFSQSNAWTAAPDGNPPAQWHGMYKTATASTTHTSVMAIRVDCGGFGDVSASATADGGFVLRSNGIAVQLTREGLVTALQR